MKKSVVALLFLFVNYSKAQITDNFLGEELEFDVQYGFLKIGEGKLNISPEYEYPRVEEPYYFVSFEIKSAGIVNFLYPNLHIVYESFLSKTDFIPASVRLKMYYKGELEQIDYYTYSDSIYIESHLKTKDKIRNYTFEITNEPRRDILGTYLTVRKQNLNKISKETKFQFYLGNSFNDLYVYPQNDTKEIEGQLVNKHQFVIPSVKDLPKNRKSYAWLSEENIPLKLILGTRFGSIVLVMKD